MLVKERPILFSGPMVRAILEGRKTQTRRVLKIQPTEDIGQLCVGNFCPTLEDKDGEIFPGDEIFGVSSIDGEWGLKCPFGPPGLRLWVRETFVLENGGGNYELKEPLDGTPFKKVMVPDAEGDEQETIEVPHYRATEPDADIYQWDCINGDCGHENGDDCNKTRWNPSIHMPRWASRIDLEVGKVRVERLQDISEEDAKAEGVIQWAATNFEGPAPVETKTYKTGFFALWEKINGLKSWNANPWVWVVEFKRIRP